MVNEPNSLFYVVHAEKTMTHPFNWKIVFRLLVGTKIVYHGIWTDNNYDVIK